MTEDDPDFVVLSVRPSVPRRWMGICSLVLLGGVLLYVAGLGVAPILGRIVYALAALAVFRAAMVMHEATRDSIVLTRKDLRTGSGRILTNIDNVERVDRSVFAFKPSNGFLVRLKQPSGKGWALGLFWQRGRTLGVGGVLPGGETRAMADLLSGMLDPDDGEFRFKV